LFPRQPLTQTQTTMTKTWFNMTTAENGREAEVSIYDAIGGYDINAKQFVSDLNEIQAETIHLRINSPGGSVIDGTAIFNALKRHSAKVITHVDGLAASMASVIAMAGDEVHMADNALMMIHNPWTISMGDADELRADADLLDKMQASILTAYGRSQYEPEEIKDLMDAETWFTAQEAFDAGLVDHIEGGLRAAAADFAALAASSELTIPAEKQVASLNKQIEAITKASAELSAELEEKAEQIESLAGELVQAKLDNEQAVLEKEAAEEITEAAKADLEKAVAELEAKAAEIEEAKEVTETAVAAKAAELVQVSAHEPVVDNGDGLGAESDEQLLARYESISDTDDRRDFFAANKTKILRAKARLINN
jgi:ATP-dependent Clp protease, protease subunit